MSYFHGRNKNYKWSLQDEYWFNAMHVELDQFIRNHVWELVEKIFNVSIIGMKWIFKNKLMKMRLLLKTKHHPRVYTSRRDRFRLDYRCLCCTYNLKLYQMDMKSVLLNRYLKRKFMLDNPRVFKPHYPDMCWN